MKRKKSELKWLNGCAKQTPLNERVFHHRGLNLCKSALRIRDRSYEDRLKMRDLFKLRKRRLKLIKGINQVNDKRFFRVSLINRTGGHEWKLAKEKFRTDIGKYFFTQRVINVWSSSPGHSSRGRNTGGVSRPGLIRCWVLFSFWANKAIGPTLVVGKGECCWAEWLCSFVI